LLFIITVICRKQASVGDKARQNQQQDEERDAQDQSGDGRP
jgi:hypothetical protein